MLFAHGLVIIIIIIIVSHHEGRRERQVIFAHGLVDEADGVGPLLTLLEAVDRVVHLPNMASATSSS